MAFKLKNDKASLFGINGSLSTHDTPVFMKDLDGDIVAEANRDGTIFIDKKASPEKQKEALAHEMVHMEQMKQGRLYYDDNKVEWKKDTASPCETHLRKDMNEGAHDLEWEKEAWAISRNIKRKKRKK